MTSFVSNESDDTPVIAANQASPETQKTNQEPQFTEENHRLPPVITPYQAAKNGDADAALQIAADKCHEIINTDSTAISLSATRKSRACVALLQELSDNQNNTAIAKYFSFYLAKAYTLGKGVPVNERKAEYWVFKSALLGSPTAQGMLGLLHTQKKEFLDAYIWLNLAYMSRDNIDPALTEMVTKVLYAIKAGNVLTPDEIQRGDKLVESYRPRSIRQIKKMFARIGATPAKGMPVKQTIPARTEPARQHRNEKAV